MPKDELSAAAGLRDLFAGVALLSIGVATNTSTFTGDPGDADAIDLVLDALGCFWIVWGGRRLVAAWLAFRQTS